MCGPGGSHRMLGTGAYECCCCGPGAVMLFRHFVSRKEELERLEEYRDQLKKELTGLEERIQESKGK